MNTATARKAIEDVAAIVGLVSPAVPFFVSTVFGIAQLFVRPPKREDGTIMSNAEIRDRVISDAGALYREASEQKAKWEAWRTRSSD